MAPTVELRLFSVCFHYYCSFVGHILLYFLLICVIADFLSFQRISAHYAPGRKVSVTRVLASTALSPSSCAKEVTSRAGMVLAARASTARSLRMRVSKSHTPSLVSDYNGAASGRFQLSHTSSLVSDYNGAASGWFQLSSQCNLVQFSSKISPIWACPFLCLPVCLSMCLSACLSLCVSISFICKGRTLAKIKNVKK